MSAMHPFLTRYTEISVPKLLAAKQYESPYLIPKVTKVSINTGLGDVLDNKKAIEEVAALLSRISGQKAVETKARKAVAGFKIRQEMVVGMKVTLRGTRMNDFLMKFSEITLPRTRDFRGLKPSAITADGNLNIGIKDSMIFPEASQDGVSYGLQVTLVSTARTKEDARLLFESLGFVFNPEEENAPKKSKRTYKRK